mgnify:FL=1
MKIEYSAALWVIAEHIGYARHVLNKKNNKIKTRFDRGDKNKYVDTIGVLGELIALEHLTRTKTNYKMARLLDYTSSKNADFIINNKKVDVKTNTKTKHSHLLVNKEAHIKGKNKIDKYWFIYILNKTQAEMYLVDYNDVNTWRSKLMKYTDAFYIKKEQLLKQ